MIKELIVFDHKRSVKTGLAALETDKTICSKNKKLIKAFVRDCYAEGLGHARVMKYIILLKKIARMLAKPFPNVQIEDLKALLEKLELSELSAWSKCDYRIAIRRFWRWLSGEDRDPPLVRWISTHLTERRLKRPSDLLSEKEIECILQHANHPRDRAMIAILWETGCRASELLTLRIKSFKDEGEICFLDVSGKTGDRRIPIVSCVPHITKWLSFHPFNSDKESPMWTHAGVSDKILNLRYGALCYILRKLVIKAGIKKRVHPHLFRHSRATFLAKHLTEAQMKQFFGWTQGSDMAAIYVHLSGRDIQDSILNMYGKKQNLINSKPLINIETCPRCSFENASGTRFCGRCGSIVSQADTVSLSQKMQIYDELLNALLADGKVVKSLGKQLIDNKELAGKLKQLLNKTS